jgi:hypothetical protein
MQTRELKKYDVSFTINSRLFPTKRKVQVDTFYGSQHAEHLIHSEFGSFKKTGTNRDVPSDKVTIHKVKEVKKKKGEKKDIENT